MNSQILDPHAYKRIGSANTNFSSSINTSTRVKVINDARPLLTAQFKCKEIWQALQVADYKKSGILNEAALKVLIEKQGKNLSELLFIRTPEDLIELFDVDEDGFLNEDEQIMIFSMIKERMQTSAEELCKIHEYNLFKEIMKGIRCLEDDIYVYQKVMRNRNQKKEMASYHEISENKLKRFRKEWEQKFEAFENTCQIKLQDLQSQHNEEKMELELQLATSNPCLRIKPKIILKSLQVKEKLVAVNERFGEAQIIRRELKSLELNEQNRVENLILKEHEKKRIKLNKKQSKEIELQMLKNREMYDALIIQKDQARVLLQKKIRFDLNNIVKSQKFTSSVAEKLAKTRDELRRTKNKSKKVQVYLSEAKSLKSQRKTFDSLPLLSQTISYNEKKSAPSQFSSTLGYKPSGTLKQSLSNITKFQISSESISKDIPINSFPDLSLINSNLIKSSKILKQYTRNSKSLFSLTSLYDKNLKLVNIPN